MLQNYKEVEWWEGFWVGKHVHPSTIDDLWTALYTNLIHTHMHTSIFSYPFHKHMHMNISVHTPLLPLAHICMHTHADFPFNMKLYLSVTVQHQTKIVWQREREREEEWNLSSIQSKWGVNGSFFIREQLSKQGWVGERGGGRHKGISCILVQWWWYQMVILWYCDICNGSESLPYSYCIQYDTNV